MGNWISSGINEFSIWIRHDAPVSLDFFVRFATAGNFPGTAADKGVLIAPNAWTKISYEIAPSHINEYLFPKVRRRSTTRRSAIWATSRLATACRPDLD